MKLVKELITIAELKIMAEKIFGGLVKAIVDVEKNIMAVDGALHSDILEFLVEEEKSNPRDLWGINLYPDETGENFIEFDSVMNLKPDFNNKTRGVENAELREKIISIVNKLVV